MVSKVRLRRRRKDRRGQRWMRGQLMMGFGSIGGHKFGTQRSGQLNLSSRFTTARLRRRDRNRGRVRQDRHRRSQSTIKGIPFNYYYSLNRLFNRLSISVRTVANYRYTLSSLSELIHRFRSRPHEPLAPIKA